MRILASASICLVTPQEELGRLEDAGIMTMTDSQLLVADTLGAAVDELCQKFGAWRTARALLLVAWRRHQTHTHISELSNYQLRDIGMPEKEDMFAQPNFLFRHIRPFG